MVSKGFPQKVVTQGRQYNIGESPAPVSLYTYIDHHGGTPNKAITKEHKKSRCTIYLDEEFRTTVKPGHREGKLELVKNVSIGNVHGD